MRSTPFLAVALLACLGSLGRGQDTPLTKMEPIRYDSSFISFAGFNPNTPLNGVWRVSPDAKHHESCVRIQCPTGFAGSGVVVATTDKNSSWILTNHHVVEVAEGSRSVCQTITVEANGGKKRFAASLVMSNPSRDVAIYRSSTPHPGVPIAASTPGLGTDLELVGYGGPNPYTQRHFLGQRVHAGYTLSIAAATISGDSGGGIFHQGELVGINWGGPGHPTSSFGGWGLINPATSHVNAEWLAQTLTAYCTPQGCRPLIGGGRVIYEQPQQPAPQPQPQPQQPGCECDQETLKQQIIDQLKNDPSLRGEQGPPGPQGEAGQGVTNEQLGAIAAAITEQLRQDPSLQGPPGPAGKDGKDGSDGADGRDAILDKEQLREAIADYFMEVDPAVLAQMIQPHLDPIYPMWVDNEMDVIDEIPGGVRLGEALPLRLDVVERRKESQVMRRRANAGTRSQ